MKKTWKLCAVLRCPAPGTHSEESYCCPICPVQPLSDARVAAADCRDRGTLPPGQRNALVRPRSPHDRDCACLDAALIHRPIKRAGAVANLRRGSFREARRPARSPTKSPLKTHSRFLPLKRMRTREFRAGRVEEGRGGVEAEPKARFPSPLIKPDVRVSRIRLSDGLHCAALGGNPAVGQRVRQRSCQRETGAYRDLEPCGVV